MSRNEEIAMVLRAAAQGYMGPYNFQPPGFQGAFMSPAFDSKSYDAAKSVAGALNAIAAVYEGLAKTEAAKLTDEASK